MKGRPGIAEPQELEGFDPHDAAFRSDPFPVLDRMRSECPASVLDARGMPLPTDGPRELRGTRGGSGPGARLSRLAPSGLASDRILATRNRKGNHPLTGRTLDWL